MKLIDAILLSLSVAFFIIGVHQTIVSTESVEAGVANAYVFYMTSLLLLFWYRVRRKKQQQENKKEENKQKNRRKRRSK
jgi:hypothetical protein